VNLRALVERIRDSHFLIPALCIAASVGLALGTTFLDRSLTAPPLAIDATVTSARSLLSTVAGAVITVAALVFSLSAVTMQLAASQYSPRVVQGFLRDRLQQFAFGITMGTFTYALIGLAGLPPAAADQDSDWTATTAVVLAVLTAVVIVAFIDHVVRKVRIDDTVRRLASRTEAAFDPPTREPIPLDDGRPEPDDVEPEVIRAPKAGYVQGIDLDRLVDMFGDQSIARLDVWAGHFVTEGRRLVTFWQPDDAELPDVTAAIAIGDQRTIEQDPGFGLRQLVDIALRALSPGINDPATAADVVRRLTGCLRAAYLAGEPRRVFHSETGGRLLAPHAPSVSSFVVDAITPIRRAAADQPLVLTAIVDALEGLRDEMVDREIDTTALGNEVKLATERLDRLHQESHVPGSGSA